MSVARGRRHLLVSGAAVALAFVTLAAPLAPAASAAETPAQVQGGDGGMPVYRPPLRGAPGGRVGAATRGAAGDAPSVEVLAPDHVGFSASAQPVLYWYISKGIPSAVHLQLQTALQSESAVKPLLEKNLDLPRTAGLHALRLADYGVQLERKTVYQWSVALVVDPNERSSDVVASGMLEFVAPDASQHLPASGGAKLADAGAFAAAGYWYDAIDAAEKARTREPGGGGNAALAALLEQAALADVAAYVRANPAHK